MAIFSSIDNSDFVVKYLIFSKNVNSIINVAYGEIWSMLLFVLITSELKSVPSKFNDMKLINVDLPAPFLPIIW